MKTKTAKTEIEELILTSPTALSPAEIKKATKGLCNRVTIYRILDRLVKEESIHKVILPDGGIKYAACQYPCKKYKPNHAHFSCTKCKAVTCLEHIEPLFKLHKTYSVQEIHCTIVGICARCSK